MQSIIPKYLNLIQLSPNEASTLQGLGEHKGRQELFTQQTPEVLETLREVALIESTESSNRLEGITAPHARVEALVAKSTAPRDRSEAEIVGYRDALALIHESSVTLDVSVNTILQLHALIHRQLRNTDMAGQWKQLDNRIVEKTRDGTIVRTRFTPVTAHETPQAMDFLVQNYRACTRERVEPLILIPLTVLDFLCIHPFEDGNGRVARLLTILMLYHADYQVGRYISLERIIEESKETYYETLEHSSQQWHQGTHDAKPWMRYFWGVLIAAYKEFEARVGKIRHSPGGKSQHVRDAIMRRLLPFAISDLEKDCPGISRELVRLVLKQMRDEGLLTVTGRGPGARWVPKERHA